jgi:hypothetical protein
MSRPTKLDADKKNKISITISPAINKHMELESINKSKLINKLLDDYFKTIRL